MFGNTVSKLFETRYDKDRSKDNVGVDEFKVVVAVSNSKAFLANSVLRKLKHCTSLSSKLASRSLGRMLLADILHFSPLLLLEDLRTFAEGQTFRQYWCKHLHFFLNSSSRLSITTKKVPVRNFSAGVCSNYLRC